MHRVQPDYVCPAKPHAGPSLHSGARPNRIHPTGLPDRLRAWAYVIIFGTGFHVTDPPFADHLRGRDGNTLAECWNGSPQ